MYKAIDFKALEVSLDLKVAFELAAQYGFKGIYLHPEYLTNNISTIKEMLSMYNLKSAALFSLPVNFRESKYIFEKELNELTCIADNLIKVDCDRISTWIIPGSNTLDYKENFELHKKRLKRVAHILQNYNIDLGLEFLGPTTLRNKFNFTFIHSISGILELCDSINMNNVGIVLDSWHWYTAGHTVEDLSCLNKDIIKDVHVNDAPTGVKREEQIDNIREFPGETGVINIREFMHKIAAIKYDGPVMVEPFHKRKNHISDRSIIEFTARTLTNIWDTYIS